ncbi:IS110 family transposase [Bacillota bacterium LX-D]|nr:IS110 family transposase [Bacillota bacterium LX-D]
MGKLKIVYPICCGMDVHRDFVIACIASTNIQGVTQYQSRRFSTYSGGLRLLRDWLSFNDCRDVCMESTGKYWFPVHNILEVSCNLVVSHPKFVKAIKGKKTDKKDAQWIADLFKHDLVRGSFIPPKDIRQLRDLCRYWCKLTAYMTGEKNRAQNCLTVSNFKLDDVFSNVFGKSASAITTQLLEHPGESFDVTPFVDGRCKTPIAQIQEAVDGRFEPEQAEKLKIIRNHMDSLERHKADLESLILSIAEKYIPQIELLLTVPGINDAFTAIRILAEIGADMSVFETSKHLCSWAGLTPQNNESAGKKKTTRIGKSGAYIKPLLVQIALASSRSEKYPEVRGKHQALKKRRGGKKATIAIARRLLTAIYQILKKGEAYNPSLYSVADHLPISRQISQEQAVSLLTRMGYILTESILIPVSS